MHQNPGLPVKREPCYSKLKEFADDNFKFEENGIKLSKRVENTVGQGEIAHHEQFLLAPQCFQKAFFPEVPKGVNVREWVIQRFFFFYIKTKVYGSNYSTVISPFFSNIKYIHLKLAHSMSYNA